MVEQTIINEILNSVRQLNTDEFNSPVTSSNTLNDVLIELNAYKTKELSKQQRIDSIIEHIVKLSNGEFLNPIIISSEQDKIDVIGMGLNTFSEELKANAVSIKAFDNLFNSLSSPFFIINIHELSITKLNESALQFFQYDKRNRYNIPIADFFNESLIVEITDFCAKKEVMRSTELSILINGKKKHILVNFTRLDNSYHLNPSIAIFITDITAQSENEKLIKAKEIAEKSSKMKEEFLANMSHELRTPMNAIVGLSNLMTKAKQIDEKQTEYVRAININSKNLLGIINNILDYSKIEAGKIDFENIDFSIRETVDYLNSALARTIADKGLKFNIHTEKEVPEFVNGDSVKLNQILTNLISNAIKFTQEGSISLHISVTQESSDKTEIQFKVKDTGIGIPSEKQEHIFDSFTQASSDTTRKYGGTGLGLCIVKKIIELQKGSISLKSELGFGSEFTVLLPFNIAEEKPQTISFENPISRETLNVKILLVEDNPFNQLVAIDTIKENLNLAQIETADNGSIALQKLKNEKFDLILMDIQMPEMDGHTATRIIRNEIKITTPIIAMTAHASAQEIENCYSNGMNEHITKPFESEKLIEKIEKLLSIKSNDTPTVEVPSSTGLVNTAFITNFCKGNKERIEKMTRAFINDTPTEVLKMKLLLEEENFKALKILAHSLKPRFTYMGMPQLSKLIQEIEFSALESNDKTELQNKINHVSLQCDKAIVELKEFMSN